MRTTTLVAALTVLLAGCFDSDPTAPDETGPPVPEPALDFSGPQVAAVATNFWATKAPVPTARWYATAAVVNDLLYLVGLKPPPPLLTMGWCIECHRRENTARGTQAPLDCVTCHH